MQPWGRFATLGLAAVALLVGQFIALAALIWWYGLPLGRLPDLTGDGVAVTLIILVSTPIEVALLMLFTQRSGVSAAEYLGWTMPKRADVVFGVVAVAIFIVVADIVSLLAGHGLVTSFQTDIYTTGEHPGVAAAVVARHHRGDARSARRPCSAASCSAAGSASRRTRGSPSSARRRCSR